LYEVKQEDYILPGSVRALITLCFLLLTVILAISHPQYLRHALNHSVTVKLQEQEKLFQELKEKASPSLLIKQNSINQEDDDVKA